MLDTKPKCLMEGNDEDTQDDVHFSPPGAVRWMATGIYCLKIYLFREQFTDSKEIIAYLLLHNYHLYQSSCDAPYNDLCLFQSLEAFLLVDKEVAKEVLP